MPASQATSLECSQDVLAVGGAVLHPADQLDQLGVQAVHARLVGRLLARLDQLLVDLPAHLGHDLLDAARVDAAVGDQRLERAAGDLAAHRVEAGDDHRVGRVVDDDVHAGGGLEGADVPALAADDAALHFVAGQRHGRHGGLGGLVGGDALDGHGDDPAGLAVGALRACSLMSRPAPRPRRAPRPRPAAATAAGRPRPSGRRSAPASPAARPQTARPPAPVRQLLVARSELLAALAQLLLLARRAPPGAGRAPGRALGAALEPSDFLAAARELLLQRLAGLHRLHLGREHRLRASASTPCVASARCARPRRAPRRGPVQPLRRRL